MNIPHTHSSIAMLTLVLTLAGCASGSGSTGTSLGGGGSGSGGGSPTAQATPTGIVANKGGNVISASGDAVSNVGTTVGKIDIPLVSDQTQSDLSKVVVNTGGILSTLGKGVSDGLGKTGIVDNPLGITVENTSNVVDQAGITVQSAGTLIANLGSDKLSPLAPVTQPIGGIVTTVGSKVSDLAVPLNSILSSTGVQKVTRTLSVTIVPLTSKATTLTQQVGAATQLGQPVNDLLAMTGTQVAKLGGKLSDSGTPIVGDLGGLVTSVGNTVGVTGILVHAPNGSVSGGLGNLLGGLSNLPGNTGGNNFLSPITSTLTNLVGGVTGISGTAGGPLSPLTNTLSGVLGGGLGSTGIIAPVSSTVTGLTNTTASGGGNAHQNVLQPITGLLGGLLGKK